MDVLAKLEQQEKAKKKKNTHPYGNRVYIGVEGYRVEMGKKCVRCMMNTVKNSWKH